MEDNIENIYLKKSKKNIVLLFIAQAINVIGDDFFNIAVMWIVYSESKSTLITSIIGVVWHLTDFIISPVAGVIADTKDKRKIVFTSNIIALLFSLFIGIYALYTETFPIPLAIASIALLNILTSFINPTRSALIVNLVEKDKLKSINGAFSSVVQVSSVIGNGLAGIILSVFGIGISIIMNSFSYLIVIVCFIFFNWSNISYNDETNNNIKVRYTFLNDFILGLNYLKEQKKLIKLSIFLVLLNGISFLGTLYPAIINENLGSSSTIYGFIQTAGTLGAIIGSLFLTIKKTNNNRSYIVICLIGIAISLFGLAISKNYVVSIIMAFSQNIFMTINSILVNTLIMTNVELKYIGRMLGLIKSLVIIIIPITTIIAGWIGTFVNVQYIFICSSIYIIFIAALTPYLIKN